MQNDLHPVITRYLNRQMDPAEQQAFEARLAADPALAAEVVFYETLRHEQDRQLRARWQDLGQAMLRGETPAETAPALKVTHRRSFSRWALAASVALMIAAAGLWWITRPPLGERLYAGYYTTLPQSGSLSPNAPRDEWDQAYTFYRQKQYEKARQILTPLFSEPTNADRAYLLAGLCWLEENRPSEALLMLAQVQPRASYYYQMARWGTAFAHLRAGHPEAARPILDDLAKHAQTPADREKAAALLQKMGS